MGLSWLSGGVLWLFLLWLVRLVALCSCPVPPALCVAPALCSSRPLVCAACALLVALCVACPWVFLLASVVLAPARRPLLLWRAPSRCPRLAPVACPPPSAPPLGPPAFWSLRSASRLPLSPASSPPSGPSAWVLVCASAGRPACGLLVWRCWVSSPRVRPPVFAWSLRLRCRSCGCRFSAFAWGVRPRSLVFSPCCGRFWFVARARFLAGSRFRVSSGVPLSPSASLPPVQIPLF